MKKLSFKGILLGSITDIVASNIVQIPLFIYVSLAIHTSALPKTQMVPAVVSALRENMLYFSLSMVLGGCVLSWADILRRGLLGMTRF